MIFQPLLMAGTMGGKRRRLRDEMFENGMLSILRDDRSRDQKAKTKTSSSVGKPRL